MLKNITLNIVITLMSLAIALAISEGVIRALGAAPEVAYIEKWRMRLSKNPKIGFEPIPNFDSTGLSTQYHAYLGRANNEGFRDYDHSLAKTPGTRRILVLGDSVTAGLWVNDDESVFPVVMEKQLNADAYPAEVLNFGVPGYNTQQEVEMLKYRGLKYRPDVVVLAYCLNDRWRDDGNIYGFLLAEERKRQEGDGAEHPSLNPARIHPIVEQSALVRWLVYRVLPARFSEELEEPVQADVSQFDVDTVAEAFAELARVQAEHGFQVLVTVFPNFGKADQGLVDYQHMAEHEAIAALAQQHQFAYFDLLDTFRHCKELRPDQLVSFDHYHPRPYGYSCAGHALADRIRILWP